MAVHVEDHPLDYFDFEGVIAAGGYGAGDVIVWDWGTWELAKGDDPLVAVAKGDLHFDLVGEKLAGRFALVRRGDDKQWLLIKKHDDAARPGWEPGDHPRSVKSGRTNDEVRDSPAATWSSDEIWAAPTTEELAALDELGRGGTWRFGDRQLELTDLDAVAVRGVTRRDLVRHHAVHAPVMLPYLAGRTVDTPAALVEEVAGGAVALHAPTTTVADPDHPTWVVMDIRADDIEDALVVARLHRAALDHLDIDARPVVLGDGGVQVWIPIARRYTRDSGGSVGRRAGHGDPLDRPRPRRCRSRRDRAAGRPVQRAPLAHRAGRRADHVGRARRAAATLDRWRRRRAHRAGG